MRNNRLLRFGSGAKRRKTSQKTRIPRLRFRGRRRVRRKGFAYGQKRRENTRARSETRRVSASRDLGDSSYAVGDSRQSERNQRAPDYARRKLGGGPQRHYRQLQGYKRQREIRFGHRYRGDSVSSRAGKRFVGGLGRGKRARGQVRVYRARARRRRVLRLRRQSALRRARLGNCRLRSRVLCGGGERILCFKKRRNSENKRKRGRFFRFRRQRDPQNALCAYRGMRRRPGARGRVYDSRDIRSARRRKARGRILRAADKGDSGRPFAGAESLFRGLRHGLSRVLVRGENAWSAT